MKLAYVVGYNVLSILIELSAYRFPGLKTFGQATSKVYGSTTHAAARHLEGPSPLKEN